MELSKQSLDYGVKSIKVRKVFLNSSLSSFCSSQSIVISRHQPFLSESIYHPHARNLEKEHLHTGLFGFSGTLRNLELKGSSPHLPKTVSSSWAHSLLLLGVLLEWHIKKWISLTFFVLFLRIWPFSSLVPEVLFHCRPTCTVQRLQGHIPFL